MKAILALLLLFVVSCGYRSVGNELTGQVKRVTQVTPILCLDRVDAHISLGVMKNGTGSMSHEDVIATVLSETDVASLKAASETGALVKVVYRDARVRFCNNDWEITHVDILK